VPGISFKRLKQKAMVLTGAEICIFAPVSGSGTILKIFVYDLFGLFAGTYFSFSINMDNSFIPRNNDAMS